MLNPEYVLTLAANGDTDAIIKACKQAIIEQHIKNTGGTSLLKRIKAAQKYLSVKDLEHRLNSCGAHITADACGNQVQTFNNGISAILLYSPLPELPAADPLKAFDAVKCFNTTEGSTTGDTVPLNTAEVKAAIKIHAAEQKAAGKKNPPPPLYQVNAAKYNAKILIECYIILGGGTVTVCNNPDSTMASLIMKNENGKALILPVRPI